MAGREINRGQIDGRAGGMTGMLGDITEPEQILLAERRIIPVLGWRLPAVLRPQHHVVHRARRAVAIQHLQ